MICTCTSPRMHTISDGNLLMTAFVAQAVSADVAAFAMKQKEKRNRVSTCDPLIHSFVWFSTLSPRYRVTAFPPLFLSLSISLFSLPLLRDEPFLLSTYDLHLYVYDVYVVCLYWMNVCMYVCVYGTPTPVATSHCVVILVATGRWIRLQSKLSHSVSRSSWVRTHNKVVHSLIVAYERNILSKDFVPIEFSWTFFVFD